ncbi:MAG: phosphatidylserine decarboxylase [Clostridiaceae bacterium]
MIYDRTTKTWSKEEQFGGRLLQILYTAAFKPLRPWFLKPAFSDIAANILDKRYDRGKIQGWMAAQGIDPNLFEGYPYETFKEFFLRRYKQAALPQTLPREVIAPSDGKVVTYPITAGLKVAVKGVTYSVKDLLGGSESANLFAEGQLFIIRLSLHDCHRFIYTESGPLSGQAFKRVPGRLHTVSDYSAKEPVLKENERSYSIIESRHGLVGVMEVGALLVGRIRYHRTTAALRYRERGWFEPGGSTILLFYQKGMIKPDLDIIRETLSGNEVKVKLGERIGQYAATT